MRLWVLGFAGLFGKRGSEEWVVCDESQLSSCFPSSLCHCCHHLVPCVCPPWDHHRELWLLPVRRLDWRCAVPCGWLCHCLLLWRCPVVWWKPFLLLFRLQLPDSCQECPRIRAARLPPRCCRCWAPGPWVCLPQCVCVWGTHFSTRHQSQRSRKHRVWHFVVLTPHPPHYLFVFVCFALKESASSDNAHCFLWDRPLLALFLGIPLFIKNLFLSKF
jgi:hypothetical protein